MDTGDGILEIGVHEPGAGPEGYTSLYWYDGRTLRCTGRVEGLWIEGSEDIMYYGLSGIRVKCRLNILQIWWTEKVFRLDEEHKLVEEADDDWYWCIDDKDDHGVKWYKVLQPIRLYCGGYDKNNFIVLQPGEEFYVLRTDNKNYISVEGKEFGWLYLEDGTKFEKPEGGYYDWPGDVIEGLRLEE